MNPRAHSLIAINVAVLIWGGTAMFAKGIQLPVGHVICVRALIAAALLLAFLLATRARVRPVQTGHYGVMATLGLLLCFHWLTYFEALKLSTASVAILSLHTYPVFTAVIEPFLFGEQLKRKDIVLALLVFTGVLIMMPEVSLSNTTTRGILLGILSGLFFMARNLMTRKYVRQYSGSVLMFWQTLVTGIVLTPLLFMGEAVTYAPRTMGLLLLLGTLFTAVPQTLYASSLKHLSARTVGVLATLLPFYGALFGYLIHEEEITTRTAIGGLIVLICIIFETVVTVQSRPS